MEEGNEAFNRALWFAIGYFTAFIVEEIAEALIKFLLVEEKEPTSGTAILDSSNGTTGEKGETVTSLVKEETTHE